MPSQETSVSKKLLDVLQKPPPKECYGENINWLKTDVPEYAKTNTLAILIHNMLSQAECVAMLSAAEASAPRSWEPALVNVGRGREAFHPDTRHCDRIIWDNPEVTAALMERILPYLPENIISLHERASVTGLGPVKRKEKWRISKMNERMRFLKYTSGMYFREHCDGSYVSPDGKEVSFLTVHIYLNGTGESDLAKHGPNSQREIDSQPLKGGATRIFGETFDPDKVLDVEPKMGMCLVFQHRGVYHSGEDVVKGTKYTMRSDIMYTKVE